MILSFDEKDKVIDYLKTSRKASQTGKYDLIESLSTDEKQEMSKIFSRLRDQGILCYLNRKDELVFKKISPFNLDYDWEPPQTPDREEFDEKKCQQKCKECQQLDVCQIRMREWNKNIESLMNRKRNHPDGHLISEEIIEYMQKSFMGGL
jgi:hypothetical protein